MSNIQTIEIYVSDNVKMPFAIDKIYELAEDFDVKILNIINNNRISKKIEILITVDYNSAFELLNFSNYITNYFNGTA